MPRSARIKTNTKVYHVINRGINKQDIFLDNQDFINYINEIKNTKEKYEYEIFAYALMNDHVHFIIFDKNDNISKVIQSLNVRYTMYFNKKYERVGHLFENRFKSYAINNQEYLKKLVRYIHKNPENAGLKPYLRTSYYEYISKAYLINPIQVLKCFGEKYSSAINSFIEFHKSYNMINDLKENYEMIFKMNDEDAIKIIKKVLKEDNLLKVQNYDKDKRYSVIGELLQIKGITNDQLARIIGINRKTIRKIKKELYGSKGTDAPKGNVPNWKEE